MDPRRPQFCIERQIIGAAAANLKGKGLGKKGLGAKVRQKVLKKIPAGIRQEKRGREENDEGEGVTVSASHPPPPKKNAALQIATYLQMFCNPLQKYCALLYRPTGAYPYFHHQKFTCNCLIL